MTIEYLDAKRVQGVGATGTTGWTESGSEYTLTGNQIDFALKRDGNFQTCYYDLGANAVSDTWVLRMHVHFTTNSSSDSYTKVSFWGLSSTNGNFSATQDTAGMVINWSNNASEKRYYISEGNDTDAEGTSKTVLDTNWTSSDNYYIQIRRTDSITLKAQLYSDSTYETTVGSEATESSFAGAGLRYVKFAFPNHSSQAEIQNGIIDKIEFYDGVTTASGDPTLRLLAGSDKATLVTPAIPAPTAAIRFDASNDYVDLNSTLISGTGDFSVSMWFRHTGGTSGNDGLLTDAGSKELLLYQGSTQKIASLVNPSGTILRSSIGISQNTWYHLVLLRTGSTLKLYVNGSSNVATQTNSSTVGTNETWIGTTGSEFWGGEVTDVAFWNGRVLSTTEIDAIYNSGSGKPVSSAFTNYETSLTGYYPFTTDVSKSAGSVSGTPTASGAASVSITSPIAAIPASSDLQENTIFNETDTYKQYWLQDGEWVYKKLTEAFTASGYTGSAFINNTWTYSGSTWSAGGNFPRNDKGLYGASFGGNAKAIAGGGGDGDNSGGSYSSYTYDGSSWSSAINWDSGRAVREGRGGAGDKDGATFAGGKNYDGDSKNWAMKFNGSSWSNINDLPWNWRNGGSSGTVNSGLWISGYNSSGASAKFDGTNFTAITNCTVTGNAGTAGANSNVNGVYRRGDDFVKWNGSAWSALADGLASSGFDSGGGGGTPDAFMMIGYSDNVELWDGTTWSVGNAPTATYDAPASNATVG